MPSLHTPTQAHSRTCAHSHACMHPCVCSDTYPHTVTRMHAQLYIRSPSNTHPHMPDTCAHSRTQVLTHTRKRTYKRPLSHSHRVACAAWHILPHAARRRTGGARHRPASRALPCTEPGDKYKETAKTETRTKPEKGEEDSHRPSLSLRGE